MHPKRMVVHQAQPIHNTQLLLSFFLSVICSKYCAEAVDEEHLFIETHGP